MVILRKLQDFFRKLEHLCLPALQTKLKLILATNCDLLVAKMLDNPKYADPKRLETYGFSVYSQNDEDGIIQEIFNRIGTSSKTFVEFGVGYGLENNTAYLLMQGWKGLWIEGSSKFVKQIKRTYKKPLENKQLIC